MMAMRSDSRSASSMKCVVRMMALPSLNRRITSQVFLRLKGSIPLVGSSRNTTLGLPRKAMPMESFLFCPPDRVSTASLNFSSRPTSTAIFRISA
mmetsp:Transcript_4100/g.5434  ORF Transcript_4100/g.5434 Transcript_4100/m.5434 type:complete len:95 (+) Transcript_4100:3198-3482(+)